MKKIVSTIFLITFLVLPGFAQTLTRENFNADIIPSFMGSGTSTRLPVVFRATVTNLTPLTTYRYFIQGAIFSDLGGTNPGAGNPLFMNPDSSNFRYSTSASLTNAAGYDIFTTNAAGEFTGWFSFANTGNGRFTAGNYISPTISIGDTGGALVARRALNDSILVLSYSTSVTATGGSGIFGKSLAGPKNLVLLYSNTQGTGKPASVCFTEDDGVTIASSVQFYTDSVNAIQGRWGTIIPNTNPDGIRRIELRGLATGELYYHSTNPDGNWGGGANTVNPVNGTTPLVITSADAPLPVELTSFYVSVNLNSVNLTWETASELNTAGFEIQKSSDSENWIKSAFMVSGGTSVSGKIYKFSELIGVSGKICYRLKIIDNDGSFSYSDIAEAEVLLPVSDILMQNYPNPFNPSTKIRLNLAPGFAGDVTKRNLSIKIYDILGNEVRSLVDGELAPGYHELDFNATGLAGGIYYCRMLAGSLSQTIKMILLQ